MAECRFDRDFWVWSGGPELLVEDQATVPGYGYGPCLRCGAWHWVMPALEIDGTAPSKAAMDEQIAEAAVRAGLRKALEPHCEEVVFLRIADG